MANQYLLLWGMCGGLSLLAASPVQAQAPTIVATVPAARAVAVPRASPVEITFSQPLTAASASALKVYSAQRGGLRTAAMPAQVSGSTLRFVPAAYSFQPGEKVQATVTRAASGSGGALARPRVFEFTAASRPTRAPNYQVAGTLPIGYSLFGVAVGDVDGDGDLDLVASSFDNTTIDLVQVRLNGGDATGSNTGVFSNGSTVPVGDNPYSVDLADVDGDGDLDLLTACGNGPTLSVRLNGGNATGSNTGIFSGGQDLPVVGQPYDAAVGDVDGDGDLDVVTSSLSTPTVSVSLNGGNASGTNTGVFAAGQTVAVANYCNKGTLSDVDNDGDLDILATCLNPNVVCVRLNGGDATGSNTGSNTGIFSGTQNLALSTGAGEVAMGDVDGDGDSDLLVLLSPFNGPGGVDLWLNGGTGGSAAPGIFVHGSTLTVGNEPYAVVLADAEGDGDLDVFVTCNSSFNLNLLLNSGTGTFTATTDIAISSTGLALALGDLDGDLDIVRGSTATGNVDVLLNRTTPLAAALAQSVPGLRPYPNPATGQVRLTLPPTATSAELLDALGRVVRTVPAPAGTATLDLSGLALGLYLVRATGQVARLVVE